jgi:two-component system sensor histidine kinase KdpD
MGIAYFGAAVVTGTLTHRIRSREKMLRLREERTEILYEIVKAIAGSNSKDSFIDMVVRRASTLLNADCAVLLNDISGNLELVNTPGRWWIPEERELGVAKYSFANNRPAGWSTDTLPSADSLFLPLAGRTSTVGVFVFRPKTKTRLLPEDSNFLNTIVRQLAVGIERENLNEKSRIALQLQESERLHQTILDSISHEIRTPLTAIIGTASALQEQMISSNPEIRKELTADLMAASERLNLVIENLLDSSRLSSGMLKLKQEWCDIKDLVSISIEKTGKALEAHKLSVGMAENLPLIFIDFHLMEQVLSNLIRNAAVNSPPETEIIVKVKTFENNIVISVDDSGPGIPENAIKSLFERFYRVPGAPSGGLGLGLWLAKNIVELHGGRISVHNKPAGGTVFSTFIPIKPQPESPPEE